MNKKEQKEREDLIKSVISLKIAMQANFYFRQEALLNKKFERVAPSDGICWCCKKQIYEKISFQDAENSFITGCPHCSRSFCE